MRERRMIFMFTVYNGSEYRFTECLLNEGRFVNGITVRDIKKTDDSFDFDENFNYYFKILDVSELQNIYSISFSAEYNTEIEILRREWNIVGRGQIDCENRRLLLINYDDIPPGWNVEEKGVGSKWVDISALSNFKIVYTYFRKNGVEYSPPIIEKKLIDYAGDDEIIKKILDIMEYYKNI